MLAAGVAVGLGLYADFGKLGTALAGFRGELFPAVLALTSVGYLLRFARWQVYLRRIDIELLAAMSVVSTAAWACEAGAAIICVKGLGLDVVAASAAVAYALGNLVGSLSFLPGGLGVAETSMTGLLRALSRTTAAGAAAATVLIRIATLWYAVAVGLVALAVEERIARRQPESPPAPPTTRPG